MGAAGIAVAGAPITLASGSLNAEPAQNGSSTQNGQCSENRLEKASKGYKPRYPGPRWHLIYGDYSGIEKFALDELQKMVQRYLPYVVEVHHAAEPLDHDAHHILLGTIANNFQIANLVQKGVVKVPDKPQGFASACGKSSWNPERKTIVIAGTDPSGALYGVIDFNQRLANVTPDERAEMQHTLDTFADFSAQDAPMIENRGIWSWGYVVYDYRRFLDNMARLRMNRLNFWNDVPPVNCREVIDYAHSRGISVVLGFSWGYDLNTLDPTSSADRQVVKDDVLCQIAEYYQHYGMDAIYFQNFTETRKKEISGQRIAVLACDWVNDIAGSVLQRYPQMKIEWGLHASSILDNYKDLEKLDPRVVIVWEDAGVIPYSYDPQTTNPEDDFPGLFNNPGATREYSRKLATFRDHSEFSMVAKGWTQIRWRTESEHHGRYIMGERSESFIENRLHERQARWDFVNGLWLQNYPEALRFYQELRDSTSSKMSVLGLIEDGLFEKRIQFGAALFAEMIWNPHAEGKEVLRRATNPYYSQIE